MSEVRTRSASVSTCDGGCAGLSVVLEDMPLVFAMSASAMGYLNRFRSTHINPQAMTASTPVLDSGILATRNPIPTSSSTGLWLSRVEEARVLRGSPNEPARTPRDPKMRASFH